MIGTHRATQAARVIRPFLALVLLSVDARAAQQTCGFEDKAVIQGWEVSGAVQVVPEGPHQGKQCLRVDPGGKALWKLRDTDGAGEVAMWIREDCVMPADPKKRRAGPRWGVLQSDGRVLTIGAIYAPYLDGANTYASSDCPDQKNWLNVQYLGLSRSVRWHKYAFRFHPEKGLSLSRDGAHVRRFNWDRTRMLGFCGLAFFGDNETAFPHTFWVDDIQVDLAGPMQVKPKPPPPPPPLAPPQDPELAQPMQLVAAVRGKHPRLLFGPDALNALAMRACGVDKTWLAACQTQRDTCLPREILTDETAQEPNVWWGLPAVALDAVVTQDAAALDAVQAYLRWCLKQEHWQEGREEDSGLGAANLLASVALAYDWLHGSLPADLLTALRQRLLLQARTLYYGGLLQKNKGEHEWQQDPLNAKRWHCVAGLALAVLAAADPERRDDDWILQRTREELARLYKWLPQDGSFHESPSHAARAAASLVLAFTAADRCLGTQLRKHPFLQHHAAFRLHMMLPSRSDAFRYGDGQGLGGTQAYLGALLSTQRTPSAQAAVAVLAGKPHSPADAWMGLVWPGAMAKTAALNQVPSVGVYADTGLVSMRSGWKASAAALLFKCGPYGGRQLSAFRRMHAYPRADIRYAHPDANSIQLFAHGQMLLTDDATADPKRTSHHNTILVNGQGQRGEGLRFTEVLEGPQQQDMDKLAFLVAHKAVGEVVLSEGEAGRAYKGLTRFRRTVVWVSGKYVLVLDDIRAVQPARIDWLLHAPAITPQDAARHIYVLQQDRARCTAQLFAAASLQDAVSDEGTETQKRGQRLTITSTGKTLRLVTLLNPWNQAGLTVTVQGLDGDRSTIAVSGVGVTDEWTWHAPASATTPSDIQCKRQNGQSVALTPADALVRAEK